MSKLDEALVDAVLDDNLTKVKSLVDRGASITYNNSEAFRSACLSNNRKIAEYLLYRGADVNARDEYALRSAVYNNNTALILILIKAGANAQAAIDFSRAQGDLDTVAKLSKYISLDKDQALIKAVFDNDVAKVVDLLKQGVDPHLDAGRLFRRAATAGQEDMFDTLMSHADKDQLPPLVKDALQGQSKAILDTVLGLGMRVTGYDVVTALAQQLPLPTLQTILSHIDSLDSSEENAVKDYLYQHIRYIEPDVFRLLITAFKFNLGNLIGYMSKHSRIDLFHVLLNERIEFDIDKAFRIACLDSNIPLAEFMLDLGADIDDGRDSNPIRSAAAKRNPEMVRFLLAKGADLKQAIERSEQTEDRDVAKYLYSFLDREGFIQHKTKQLENKPLLPQINYSQSIKKDMGHKTNTDLELLKRLKGYLHESR